MHQCQARPVSLDAPVPSSHDTCMWGVKSASCGRRLANRLHQRFGIDRSLRDRSGWRKLSTIIGMEDDEWLRDAIHDAERARASERAEESKRQTRETAKAVSAARNAETRAVAVERVQTAIKHVRRVLVENGDRGICPIFRQPNFLRRPVYGWRVNLPPEGGPVLYFEYSQEEPGQPWPSTCGVPKWDVAG